MVLAQEHPGGWCQEKTCSSSGLVCTTSHFQSTEIENKTLPKEKREHNVKISVLVTNFG
jgi:hypothetical protein